VLEAQARLSKRITLPRSGKRYLNYPIYNALRRLPLHDELSRVHSVFRDYVAQIIEGERRKAGPKRRFAFLNNFDRIQQGRFPTIFGRSLGPLILRVLSQFLGFWVLERAKQIVSKTRISFGFICDCSRQIQQQLSHIHVRSLTFKFFQKFFGEEVKAVR
jgi:hypothetical protein